MNLTNDSYLITLQAGGGTEHYYRDGPHWIKVSTRGRKFRATADQVLNHLLPALAGAKPNVSARVQHQDLRKPAARALKRFRGQVETLQKTPWAGSSHR